VRLAEQHAHDACSHLSKAAESHFDTRTPSNAGAGDARALNGGPSKPVAHHSFLLRSIGPFLACFVAIWAAFAGIGWYFPYIKNGSDVVAQTKRELAESQLFGMDASPRVVAFGDSKTLAGFIPDLFDQTVAGATRSFNLGLPAEPAFIDMLESALAAGTRPTHILVQIPPLDSPQSSRWLEFRAGNHQIAERLFPFRTLPRDAVLFLFETRRRGLRQTYDVNRRQIAQMIQNRGYFFIKSQSHFPNDQLPDHYAIATDTPSSQAQRKLDLNSASFARLMKLADRYEFMVVIIPPAYRVGEYGAPSTSDFDLHNPPLPRLRVVGPAYYLYPPAMFSDPVHLNPHGAAAYTSAVAALFKQLLSERRR
jgi:hypothetical protein